MEIEIEAPENILWKAEKISEPSDALGGYLESRQC